MSIQNLSDHEIDELMFRLFNGRSLSVKQQRPKTLRDLSDSDLLRIRSRNHPDKSPNPNLALYQAVVEEMDRRRKS